MSFSIDAKWDSKDVRTLLSALEPRQWAFATALALTRTGQQVKKAEEAAMPTSLDRPTPFTQRSLYLRKATPANQEARVWFKDFAPKGTPAGSYLMPQVHGGERKDKRFERALQYKGFLSQGKQLVPAGGAELDAYGNVKSGTQTRILSQLGAHLDPAQNRRVSKAGFRYTTKGPRPFVRRRKSKPSRYFYANPGGRGWGVWERLRGGRVLGGRMGNSIRPVFLETRKQRYKPRFAFFAIAEKTAGSHIQAEFNKAAEQTIRSAR